MMNFNWCRRRSILLSFMVSSAVLFSSTVNADPGVAHTALWPAMADPVPVNPAMEIQIMSMLGRMSLEQKVGQIMQADIASVTPEDVVQYHLGSILNGGNSAPEGKQYAAGPAWLATADTFYDASVKPQGALPIIPISWGSDAVHGDNKVIGATLFPHNIGLGAMRNPELMRKIGAVTAMEMRTTGLDWSFAPTLAVVRDDRWGRSYESYSENPSVVASYAGPLIEGLQGKIGDADWLKGAHIVATAKHFVGDGGTTNGKDQGDNASSEADLRDIQAAGYRPALAAGIQVVMASYSSWQGVKMHSNRSLLTDVLKGQLHFGGFIVGDWNGHGQIPGCSVTDCPKAVAAGLDMYMAPDSWKTLYAATLRDAKDGTLPIARLNDAVARVLRVKLRSGLFEAGRPSSRAYAGQWDKLGSAAHRAIARQAVQQSLVLLKNQGGVLPLKSGVQLLIAGDGADSFMKQCGGWTLNWQGTGLKREDFPGATTIGQGLVDAAHQKGGQAVIRPDGGYDTKPDVAVVVFGEDPYAEFQGDVPDLKFRDKANTLALLKKYQAAGIKTVAVFLSGRPMWVNPYINAADAFVAAWLPGSEGGGVADVLFGKTDFKGTLSFSWPRRADQFRLNVGDPDYDPLFAFGYGQSYAKPATVAMLSEVSGLAATADQNPGNWFVEGRVAHAMALVVPTGAVLQSKAIDRKAQEDARRLIWSGTGEAAVKITSAMPIDLSRESNGALAIEIDARVETVGTAPVLLAMACGHGCSASLDVAAAMRAIQGQGWKILSVPLACFSKAGIDMTKVDMPFQLSTKGVLDVAISRIALGTSGLGRAGCAQ